MIEINIEFLKDAFEFITSQNRKTQEKIYYSVNIIKAGIIKDKYFKKLNSDIWEIRASINNTEYRLFSFWDKYEKSLIVCSHGIVKKTQKTPIKEIRKAEKIMQEYYISKYNS